MRAADRPQSKRLRSGFEKTPDKRERKMEYTKWGTSDLTVSRICMGCMGFGDAQNGQHSWTIDRAHSEEIIKKGRSWG